MMKEVWEVAMFGKEGVSFVLVAALTAAVMFQLWWCYSGTELPVPLVTGPLLAGAVWWTGRR